MKRTLRGSKQTAGTARNIPSEKDLNPQQKMQFEHLKDMAKKYEGTGENEILRDLSGAVERGKRDGSLDDKKIDSIAAQIAPMLNSQQRGKLEQLMKTLKK